jgi:hypothetical protein
VVRNKKKEIVWLNQECKRVSEVQAVKWSKKRRSRNAANTIIEIIQQKEKENLPRGVTE